MTILLCQCIHRSFVDAAELARLIEGVRQSAGQRWIVPDLCLLAEQGHEGLAEIAAAENLVVLACSERAVRGLFRRAGLVLPAATRFMNLRDATADAVFEVCELHDVPADAREAPDASLTDSPELGDWVPWYPVLERERCVKCGQCAEFCLFDVYDCGEDGVPVVARPRNCKDNCPACARICPVNAILFPKASDPEVSGRMTPDDVAAGEQTSMSDILKKGVLDGLRQRRAQQQESTESMVRDEVRLALEERAQCGHPRPDRDSGVRRRSGTS